MVADDLDGVLVRTYGTVSAKSPEFAADRIRGDDVELRSIWNAPVCQIVIDSDRVVVGRPLGEHVLEHRLDLCRRRVLACQTEAAGIDVDRRKLLLHDGGDLLVQRLAYSARLLVPIQYGHRLDRPGQSLHEVIDAERAEEMDFHIAVAAAVCIQIVDRLLGGSHHAAHSDQDILRIGCSIVVEQPVVTTCERADLRHAVLHDRRQIVVVGVHGLTCLEVCVIVQAAGPCTGMLGILRLPSELLQLLMVNQLRQFVIIKELHLLDLVACPEPVEEVEERDMSLDC